MEKKKPYQKPTIEKMKKMDFPFGILETETGQVACRQCSSCHGCR